MFKNTEVADLFTDEGVTISSASVFFVQKYCEDCKRVDSSMKLKIRKETFYNTVIPPVYFLF